jgi:hypothetical protein
VSHLAGHITATGTFCFPNSRTVEQEKTLPRRHSSGSGTPLQSSLVLVVVAVEVAVVVSVVTTVFVTVDVAVVVREDAAVAVCVVVAVVVCEDVCEDDCVVGEVVAVLVIVVVAVAEHVPHINGHKPLIGIPNAEVPQSFAVSCLQLVSSYLPLHIGGVVTVDV